MVSFCLESDCKDHGIVLQHYHSMKKTRKKENKSSERAKKTKSVLRIQQILRKHEYREKNEVMVDKILCSLEKLSEYLSKKGIKQYTLSNSSLGGFIPPEKQGE